MNSFLQWLFPVLFLLSSCGYHFGKGEIVERYCTISVPYVEGDDEGCLTDAIVKELAIKSRLVYQRNGGDLVLNVCLFDPCDENIGFIFTRDEEGDPIKVLAANEARLSVVAKVTLLDVCTGDYILGPITIATSVTYDFEPDFTHVNFHAFSLGQLEMHNLAQDVAFRPLFKNLAQKIVDYVSYCW